MLEDVSCTSLLLLTSCNDCSSETRIPQLFPLCLSKDIPLIILNFLLLVSALVLLSCACMLWHRCSGSLLYTCSPPPQRFIPCPHLSMLMWVQVWRSTFPVLLIPAQKVLSYIYPIYAVKESFPWKNVSLKKKNKNIAANALKLTLNLDEDKRMRILKS